jgi:cytochrome b involved in lipid metabolism
LEEKEEKAEKAKKGEKEEKVYTQDDVSSGIAGGRALLLIHNTVYDVTSFVDEHPGGPQVRRERVCECV